MERKTLPKRTFILWQLRSLVIGICCVFLCLFFSKQLNFLSSVALVISVVTLIMIVWYVPTFFKSYEILLKGEAIVINYGVFIKVSHIMPYSRLIYAQSFATPLARILKLSTLTLKATRGWIIIPEIESVAAKEVIDLLSREVKNDQDL